jgi:hypothetical protein
MLYSVETNLSDDFDFYYPTVLIGKYIVSNKILTKAIHASLQVKKGVFILRKSEYIVSEHEKIHCLTKHHVKNDHFIFIARSFKNKVLEQSILVKLPS